ncbi:MAG: hypothetical protein SFT90_07495 [Rickettsiales bacterium]|nr:hypothetical protein [Rickettsiales bacterium]
MKKLLLLFVLGLSSCTSMNDLGSGRTGKSFVVDGYTYDQVWNSSLAAVRQTTGDQSAEIEKVLTISKEDRQSGQILASSGMSLFSYGEVVGVFISPPKNAPSHKIEVESRAKLKTNVTSNNWEDEVIASIRQQLSKIK